jgi:hypothetical protein
MSIKTYAIPVVLGLVVAVALYMLSSDIQSVGSTPVKPSPKTQQAYSLLVKPNVLDYDTFCYNLPPLPVRECVNGTVIYHDNSLTQMACTSLNNSEGNNTISSLPETIILHYNASDVWSEPFVINITTFKGETNLKTFKASYNTPPVDCKAS